ALEVHPHSLPRDRGSGWKYLDIRVYGRRRARATWETPVTDPRVLMERDEASGIARITINNPERRNCYDPQMRMQLGDYLDELAMDDAVKVVLFRGEGGIFSTGADMANAYTWYESPNGNADRNAKLRRPSQRRR